VRALSLRRAGELVLDDVPEPLLEDGEILVEALAVGICGTDREIVSTGPRRPPDGRDALIVGHESLGRVLEAPQDAAVTPGDLVVGIVRRPDPVPCPFCAAGQSDLCENGGYTERGILGRDGFASERFRLEPEYAVRVDPALGLAGVLVEPASVVAKAWEQLDRVVRRPRRRALVLGAGPIGLLAVLLGTQRGLEVHVVDRVAHGAKRRQAQALGAIYHTSADQLDGVFDAVVECCGALVADAVARTAPGGAVCLVGVGDVRSAGTVELAELSRDLISRNKIVMGTVNSNRRHFEDGHDALRRADPGWAEGLLTDQVRLEAWPGAFESDPSGIKSIIRIGS
jgi:glucose 1-dehydrogenase